MSMRSRTAALGGVAVAEGAATSETEEREPAYQGRVPVDESTLPEGDEAAEEQALTDLAAVTREQAESAAVEAAGRGHRPGHCRRPVAVGASKAPGLR